MPPDSDNLFDVTAQHGADVRLEFISEHARLGGSINLGAYTRLSDLFNFHDEILTVNDAKVLTAAGKETADGAPKLDVRLAGLTLVIDRSGYVPPPDADQAIQKIAHRMLAVSEAHVITGTFFIYPDAEPTSYMRAQEPKWLPLADVEVRSLLDTGISYKAQFAVLRRGALISTAIL